MAKRTVPAPARFTLVACLWCAAIALPGCRDEAGQIPASSPAATAPTDETSPRVMEDWAIRLQPGTDPEQFAREHGLTLVGPIGSLADTYLVRRPVPSAAEDPLLNDARVLWLERQVPRERVKKP